MSDITKLSLSELVKNIKEKKLSSEEVTKAFIDRSEKSKELNTYITEDYSSALEKSIITLFKKSSYPFFNLLLLSIKS